jgi:hypothetical protein
VKIYPPNKNEQDLLYVRRLNLIVAKLGAYHGVKVDGELGPKMASISDCFRWVRPNAKHMVMAPADGNKHAPHTDISLQVEGIGVHGRASRD